jgi:hypothetical protein
VGVCCDGTPWDVQRPFGDSANFQGKSQACQRFVAFSKAYSLVTDDQFIVPSTAFAEAASFAASGAS